MGRKKRLEPEVGPRRFEFVVSFTLPDGTTATHLEVARDLKALLGTCGGDHIRVGWEGRRLRELKAKFLNQLEAAGYSFVCGRCARSDHSSHDDHEGLGGLDMLDCKNVNADGSEQCMCRATWPRNERERGD